MQQVASPVIIDRIAVVIGNSIIKDSEIAQDIRVTAFLNGEALDFSAAKRKKAANRLIDQIFIRREIRVGGYPSVTPQDADVQLNALKKQRFKTADAFEEELRRYGLTELALRTEFQWQLTVLRFIDVRFKPAVLVSDDEIEKYYRAHPNKSSLAAMHDQIADILTGEKVNQVFFAWLDQQRKDAKIQFQEGGLT
ncbi:MAG TPA: hypothetical protein VGG97_28460 [Bryobacteraceae bacterium]|jgi:hypothetical protein